jgi:hypothetical protein
MKAARCRFAGFGLREKSLKAQQVSGEEALARAFVVPTHLPARAQQPHELSFGLVTRLPEFEGPLPRFSTKYDNNIMTRLQVDLASLTTQVQQMVDQLHVVFFTTPSSI